MRKIIFDFYITELFPLCLVALASLWKPVRAYLSATVDMRREKRIFVSRTTIGSDSEETTLHLVQWRSDRSRTKRDARRLLLRIFAALIAIVAFTFMPNRFQLIFVGFVSQVLAFTGFFAFLGALGAAVYYGQKQKWLKFGLALLAMLLSAASAEHIIHQSTNAWHTFCPDCANEDPNPSD